MEINFKDKVVFISGASRGIGRAIALRLAKDGARIAVAAKTSEPHPKLEGTIHTVCEEIEKLGGKALPLAMDVRVDEAVEQAVAKTVQTFGGIDILINNASAISPTPTVLTEMKRFDLMFDINVRGTFLTSKLCIPHLEKSRNSHIVNLSPPLNLNPKWFKNHVAYTISKYNMSLMVLGMAEELKKKSIAVNALWPATTIATAAIQNIVGGDAMIRRSRSPQIVADAAHILLSKPTTCTGNFFTDEELLKSTGLTDFSAYAVDPKQTLQPDFFLD